MILNGMNQKYKTIDFYFYFYLFSLLINQPSSRQIRSRQTSSRRFTRDPRDNEKGVKSLVITDETETTRINNNQ